MHKGVICGICGQWMEILTYTHIAKHSITQQEYLERFPEHCYLHLWPEPPENWRDNKYKKMREEIMRKKQAEITLKNTREKLEVTVK